MEFHEKIQELRKQKGLTQEELAHALFVSRTAISKWESGRGYPNIESLKAIGKYFSVSIDELLSGEELLTAVHQDQKDRQDHLQSLLFGLLDICIAALLFLPFFGMKGESGIQAVSLLRLDGISQPVKLVCYDFVSSSCLLGILMLVLQNSTWRFWAQNKGLLSVLLSCFGVLLFIICNHPYAAVYVFCFMIIKAFFLVKCR